ncbi:MAG TPA: hypothetical protein VEU73_14720 [Gemmatimonadales bacterium]|nr:hypothetical protein [Gemmatimonadales bacterium]
MYVQHSVHIERPVKDVSASLLEGPSKWFPGMAGKKNVSKVGLHVAGVPVRKRVEVEIGEAVRTSTWAVVPVTWKATFPEKLFPAMTGKIEIAPVSKDQTRLTVSGMYEPPLGKLGEQLDEALMHNVAQATVKELAESIGLKLRA